MRQQLYETRSISSQADVWLAELDINPSHEIFEGHFPQNPVLPGVCIIALVRDMANLALKGSMRIATVNQAKFLAIVNPKANPSLQLSFKCKELEPGLSVDANLSGEGTTFAKIKLTLKP